MNLNARCPACATVFHVLPDQLKVSAGWVRCGRCETVFDAQLHQLVARPVAPVLPASATITPPAPHSAPYQDLRQAPAASPAATTPQAPAPHTLAQAAHQSPWDRRVEPTTELSPTDLTSTTLAVTSAADADHMSHSTITALPLEQQILQQAQQQAFWRTNWVRAMLGSLGLTLMVLLVSQIAAFERQALVTQFRQSFPILQTLCKLAPCDPAPLTLPSAITLQSSSFERIGDNGKSNTFLLQWSVQNTAEHPVAVPALELSLTDAYDRTQVRRVLSATQLGLQSSQLAGGQTWQGQMQFRLDMPRNASAITNYRLLVFYP